MKLLCQIKKELKNQRNNSGIKRSKVGNCWLLDPSAEDNAEQQRRGIPIEKLKGPEAFYFL